MICNDFTFICVVWLCISTRVCLSTGNQKLVVMKTGLEDITPNSVALQLFVNVNNTGKHDLAVSLIPDQCCVDVGNKQLDCDVVEAIGSYSDIVPSGGCRQLKLVAPLLDPLDRRGYCTAYLDSRIAGRRHVMRDTVKIPIDTRVKIIEKNKEKIPNVQRCEKIDQDPLNRCQPVNCLRYYNGRKSYFNKQLQKCMVVPPCIADKCGEMPDTIYDPVKNECVNDNPVSREDIAFIKALVHGGRTPKDIVIIKNFKNPAKVPNITDTSYTSTTIEKVNSIPSSIPTILAEKPVKQCKSDSCIREAVFEYLMKNRWAFTCLIFIVILQCSLLCAMVYFFSEMCCCKRKKLVRKYFNYRQDASVTTPLIGTSNIETETTDCQDYSESSNNIEKKIKSYKACQKKMNNDVEMSLSDDILSKCLNRRDWQHKSAISEAVHDCTTKVNGAQGVVQQIKKSKSSEDRILVSKTLSDSKVYKSDIQITYENEKFKHRDAKRNKVRSIVKKLENKPSKGRKSIRNSLNDSDVVYSEQEIKCHSYNFMDDGSLRKPSTCSLTGFTPSQIKNLNYVETVKKPPSSLSTEKSAQACFTNDSIDDLLSERGMLLLAGENISKYSFSTSSNSKSISSVSSRTSKNNLVKNVLSLLHRKPKNGPVSDPGGKKSKESVDLEIIHMSHGTVYSSANESDAKKDYKPKKGKNFRTSR